jgi:hypothetical protein
MQYKNGDATLAPAGLGRTRLQCGAIVCGVKHFLSIHTPHTIHSARAVSHMPHVGIPGFLDDRVGPVKETCGVWLVRAHVVGGNTCGWYAHTWAPSTSSCCAGVSPDGITSLL